MARFWAKDLAQLAAVIFALRRCCGRRRSARSDRRRHGGRELAAGRSGLDPGGRSGRRRPALWRALGIRKRRHPPRRAVAHRDAAILRQLHAAAELEGIIRQMACSSSAIMPAAPTSIRASTGS